MPKIFLMLIFLPLLLDAKPKRKTLYLPLVHISNVKYLDKKILTPPLTSPFEHKGLVFIAEVFIGSPAVRQFLHIDTGSTLTWTQCYPCYFCFDHIYPKYWPEDSTTYEDAECETTGSNPKFVYSYSTGICGYQQEYADGNFIQGTLGKEMLTMRTLDERFEVVHDVYLGCNNQARGQDYIGTGILGLGVGNFSLVEKLGSKFSFCIGRKWEHGSTHNLILGDGANIQGHPTVIIISHGHYIFQLEAVLVSEKKMLDNPLQVYLDTGSAISHLPKGLYKLIVDEVKELIGVNPFSYEPMLCYKNMDASKVPEDINIGFIFAGGAELSVDARSLFLPHTPEIVCLAINETPGKSENDDDFEDDFEDEEIIIGAIAMQGYNVGYDIKAKRVYFQDRSNCNM